MPDYHYILQILNENLNKVSGIENKSIQYKITKIEELLKDLENKYRIRTSSLISREKLANKIHKEQNFIRGYRKLIASDHFLNSIVKDKLEFCKIKVNMYERELRSETFASIYNSKIEKVVGCVSFEFLKFEFDPIFEIKSLKIFVDLNLKMNQYIESCRRIDISFEYASELEIFLIGNDNVILGGLLIPCDFLIDKEDTVMELDFGNYNYITVKVSFKKEIKLIRKNASVNCVYKLGHGLEVFQTYSLKICGVCGKYLYFFVNNYRCFRCKFACHKNCSDILLFRCKNSNDENEGPFRINYGIPHIFEETKNLGIGHCNHCGDIVTNKTILNCMNCEKTFHVDCKEFVFDCCKIDMDLRIKMSEFKPRSLYNNLNDQKVHIKDFELIRTLGRGHFGKVILARYINTDQIMALKVLTKHKIVNKIDASYVETERKVLRKTTQFNHPFLMQLYFCFQDDTRLYFATEYLAGGDLFHHTTKQEFSESNIKLYACEILLGLEFLHRNHIIYRDLKLDNILLTEDGHIKICDFGLCKENTDVYTYSYTFCGTLDTMAPEIIKNKGYTNAVDWWSYGVVLYELYTKTPPFTGTTNRDICSSIVNSEPSYPGILDDNTRDLITGLLNKNPEFRLGFGEEGINRIKNHPYFSGVNWNDIFRKKINPEFKPGRSIFNFEAEITDDLILLSDSVENNINDYQFSSFN
ncbi:hypothetical protein P3W45_001017 [Vairimorpha bombi]|jgi:serine/threonine protein kinase